MVFPEIHLDTINQSYKKFVPEYVCQYAMDRHKCAFLPLKSNFLKKLDFTLIEQTPETFVIVGPGAFHQGVNLGMPGHKNIETYLKLL